MGKFLTHEEFLKKLHSVHKDRIVAIDMYNGSSFKIKFKCQLGHIWLSTPNDILKGYGCPYCSGQKVLRGFNDMWTTRPDIASLLKNPEDGYVYTKASCKKVYFVCPNCGYEMYKPINYVFNKGLGCPICSDGVSYPNKFARELLKQLPVKNCVYEYRQDWTKSYRYDNYFEYNNNRYILEMDGGFHYNDVASFNSLANNVLAVDMIKTNLANQNGIKVIRIDCKKSDCDYIKNNILCSELSNIFNLSGIDWDLCDKSAHNSLLKQSCDLYASGITDLEKIADLLHIHKSTVYKYIKAGTKYGWCNYDAKTARRMPIKGLRCSSRCISIIIVDDNGNTIQKFHSIRDCEMTIREQYGIGTSRRNISRACETHEPYHGFNFRFASEFNNNN